MTLAARFADVRLRIEKACRAVGRDPGKIALVCASKTVEAARIREAYEAGLRDFGENYAQELRDKSEALADLSSLRWHFIGGLQRNKIKSLVGKVRLIHTVATLDHVKEIDRHAAALGRVQDTLIQLNLSGEKSKSGGDESRLAALLEGYDRCTHCRCIGLMTLPPFFDEPDRARPTFARLRVILEEQAAVFRHNVALQHLSMGMSGDLEVAVEEGATLVRVGTALFGPRGPEKSLQASGHGSDP